MAVLVLGGVTTNVDLATAVNSYVGGVGTAPIGSTILGFYLELSSLNSDSIVNREDWYLCKRDGGRTVADFPTPGATGGAQQRKNIFHEEKGLFQGEAVSTLGGQSFRTKQFIAIPKKYRRMGEADVWTIRYGASTDYSFCLKAIYKWYQ